MGIGTVVYETTKEVWYICDMIIKVKEPLAEDPGLGVNTYNGKLTCLEVAEAFGMVYTADFV